MKANSVEAKVAGHPVTLIGEQIKVGDVAPNFTVTNSALSDVHLADFKGRTVVLSIFPSIDTGVCAAQTRAFNKKAVDLGHDVVVLAISKDLPFALSRFCAAEGIENVLTLSDYKESEFGKKYGFLIKENQLLYRGVVVIGTDGVVKYVEYVDDMTHEPNYEAAIKAIAK